MLVAVFLLAVFVVLPALAIPYGKDSRRLDRPTRWLGETRLRTP